MFGPASLLVEYRGESELTVLAELLEGQLTTTLQAEADDDVSELAARLADISGRVLWNGWPTGVTVSCRPASRRPVPGYDVDHDVRRDGRRRTIHASCGAPGFSRLTAAGTTARHKPVVGAATN